MSNFRTFQGLIFQAPKIRMFQDQWKPCSRSISSDLAVCQMHLEHASSLKHFHISVAQKIKKLYTANARR